MSSTQLLYGLCAVALFAIGLLGAFLHSGLLARLLAVNVSGAGVLLLFVVLAYQGTDQSPDPVPHALVLTGLVVAVSATALALVLGRRLQGQDHD
ncbi:MAG: multicomponent Na+:H+ antiporter subunit C [Motiliproteus sp.]|jgi:multicomponent Na+:H+ antiporter subunit C